MKIVNLAQGSDAWLRWRKEGITATDAVILLGRSPYKKTRWRLWAEKVGYATEADLSLNPLVRKGRENEAKARQAVEAQFQDILLPVCVESDVNALIRASLDGLTSQNEPVELKCPSDKVWQEVLEQGESCTAYRMYYAQVQHQLLVTKATRGWLVFWHEQEGLKFFEIRPDPELWRRLIQEAAAFWRQVTERTEPEKDLTLDLFIPEDEQAITWIKTAREYRRMQAAIDGYQAKVDELKAEQRFQLDKLKDLMGEYRYADYAGVMVTRFNAKGRVNYTKLLEDHLGRSVADDELEAYRAEPSLRTRVTLSDSDAPRNIVDQGALAPLDEVPKGVVSFHW